MKGKITELINKYEDMPMYFNMNADLADEILELFSKFIRDEEDKFIEESHPPKAYYGGILSGMERLLGALYQTDT